MCTKQLKFGSPISMRDGSKAKLYLLNSLNPYFGTFHTLFWDQ
ncbi:hypothetical protein OIU78_014781 [Salix suchowensis]|nr:hypothetical protein OIU78_014781 [Salix suchowensis]